MKIITNYREFFSNHPLTRDDPLPAWRRLACWQIRSRLQRHPIVRWVGGQRLAVSRGMTGATGNIYAGLHEFPDMMFLLHFLREGDLFYDVGANIGSYTVLAAGVCRAHVVAFEPDPDTVNALERNIQLNGLLERVSVRQEAVGSHCGTVAFTRHRDAANQIAAPTDSDTRTVPMRSLDSLSEEPAMIKLDIEGHEEAALAGATSLLQSQHLQAIQVETTTVQLWEQLLDCGFRHAFYDPFTRSLTHEPNNLPHANVLFVRDIPFVTGRLRSADTIEILGRTI